MPYFWELTWGAQEPASPLSGLSTIASLVEEATGSSSDANSTLTDGMTERANQAMLQIHSQIEGVGHPVTRANDPLHALTAPGETVGLGHLCGVGYLLTDTSGVAANPTDPASTLLPVRRGTCWNSHASGDLS